MKISVEEVNYKFELTEERIIELGDRLIEILQYEEQTKKKTE